MKIVTTAVSNAENETYEDILFQKNYVRGLHRDVVFRDVTFERSTIIESYFGSLGRPVRFENCVFDRCRLSGITFSRAHLENVEFNNCKATGMLRISGTSFINVRYIGSINDGYLNAGSEDGFQPTINGLDFSQADICLGLHGVSIERMNIQLPKNYVVFKNALPILRDLQTRIDTQTEPHTAAEYSIKSSLAQLSTSTMTEVDLPLLSDLESEEIALLRQAYEEAGITP